MSRVTPSTTPDASTKASAKIVPEVMAEEDELVDPAPAIREQCASEHCDTYRLKLDSCNDRVRSKTATTETCMEELIDFVHCTDHCAGPKIFRRLK